MTSTYEVGEVSSSEDGAAYRYTVIRDGFDSITSAVDWLYHNYEAHTAGNTQHFSIYETPSEGGAIFTQTVDLPRLQRWTDRKRKGAMTVTSTPDYVVKIGMIYIRPSIKEANSLVYAQVYADSFRFATRQGAQDFANRLPFLCTVYERTPKEPVEYVEKPLY